MRILMLSWEYPPRAVGGLAQHVYDLTGELVKAGDEVHLITCQVPDAPELERVNGVYIYRVSSYNLATNDFLTWILQLNMAMIEKAIALINDLGDLDLIHAHDWLVAYAGRVLKHAYRLPLIATIHATEYGRNQGLHNDLQRYISQIEWWLTYEAWRVIVCSHYMEAEVEDVFQLPADKIRVVPNGVDLSRYRPAAQVQGDRQRFASNQEQIIFFVGRLVREKGVDILLESIPKVLYYNPQAKFIIAGRGPAEDYLRVRAKELGVYNRIYFTGYIDAATRDFLYREAAVAVFPSLYEPFGMVALEAMAAGTPVVVTDVGGLAEIVEHEKNGLKCYPDNPGSLADNILRLLGEPNLARRLAATAQVDLRNLYTWEEIAGRTRDVYSEVYDNYQSSAWKTDSRLAVINKNSDIRNKDKGRYTESNNLSADRHPDYAADEGPTIN